MAYGNQKDLGNIAHAWAHQTGNYSNTRGSYYYNGLSIYSYGKHFEIARIIQQTPLIIMFTTQSHSATTNRHIHATRAAIPHDATVFNVDTIHGFQPHENIVKRNIDNYVRSVESWVEIVKGARKVDYTNELVGSIKELIAYVTQFKAKGKVPAAYKFLLAEIEPTNLLGVIIEGFNLAKAKNLKARSAAVKKAEQERNRRLLEWKAGKGNKDSVIMVQQDTTLLRVVDIFLDNAPMSKAVETSLGLTFSIASCSKLFKSVKYAIKHKVTLPKGDQPIKVDGWEINRIDCEGNITAGCHKIKVAEVMEAAEKLGLK